MQYYTHGVLTQALKTVQTEDPQIKGQFFSEKKDHHTQTKPQLFIKTESGLNNHP